MFDEENGYTEGTAVANFRTMDEGQVTFPWIYGGSVIWTTPTCFQLVELVEDWSYVNVVSGDSELADGRLPAFHLRIEGDDDVCALAVESSRRADPGSFHYRQSATRTGG